MPPAPAIMYSYSIAWDSVACTAADARQSIFFGRREPPPGLTRFGEDACTTSTFSFVPRTPPSALLSGGQPPLNNAGDDAGDDAGDGLAIFTPNIKGKNDEGLVVGMEAEGNGQVEPAELAVVGPATEEVWNWQYWALTSSFIL